MNTIAAFSIVWYILWHTPGIHFIGNFAHLDISEECYLYDMKIQEFVGRTEVTLRGNGNAFGKKLEGEIVVKGYEIEGADEIEHHILAGDSIWKLQSFGRQFNFIEDSEGREYTGSDFCGYVYHLVVDKRHSEQFIVVIVPAAGEATESEEHSLCVIHAKTEEEAKELYQSLFGRWSKGE